MNRSCVNLAQSPKVKYSAAYFTMRELVFNAEARNRPWRGFATLGEANTPSEMRLSRSDQVWVSEANCEAAARPRASAESRRVRRGIGVWGKAPAILSSASLR